MSVPDITNLGLCIQHSIAKANIFEKMTKVYDLHGTHIHMIAFYVQFGILSNYKIMHDIVLRDE